MVYCLLALFGLVVVSGGMLFCTLYFFGCVLTLPVGIVTVVGTLKGYDQLMNLVLDDVKELLRGTSILHYHLSPSTSDEHTPALINRNEHGPS